MYFVLSVFLKVSENRPDSSNIDIVRFLSLFNQPKTKSHDIDSLILLSKNITEFVKTKKISQELNKIYKMPYPENTLNFLKAHKELNIFLDYL